LCDEYGSVDALEEGKRYGSGKIWEEGIPIVVFGVGTKSVLSVHTVDRNVAQAKLECI
jgi:hypothetical protein